MAETRQTHQGVPLGRRDGQPLCLNWAGCDVYGRDLLDLDETDSELVDSELLNTEDFPEAKEDLFGDININTRTHEGRRVCWGQVEAAHSPVPRNIPGNTLSRGPTYKSPEYAPTLLELEVQALAKIGVVKLYHDSRDLEREVAKADEERKLAIINRFDRERQALSPVPGQRPQQVNVAMTSGGTDLLELQKVALSSMKATQKSSLVASTSASSPLPIAGDSDLLELQKVALSSMKKTAQGIGPAEGPPSNAGLTKDPSITAGPVNVPSSNVEGNLLELQKVALASMKKLSEVLESHTSTPVSGPVPPSSAGGDLLKLQRTALAHIMQKYQNEPSPCPVSSALQTTAPTKSAQQDGGDLLELQKVALRSLKNALPPALLPVGGGASFELDKVTPKSVSSQEASATSLATVTQQAGAGDLLELQKVALRSIQNQATLTPIPQQAERRADFQDLRKKNLPSIPRQVFPVQEVRQGGEGGDLLELQKAALSNMSLAKGGGKAVPEVKEAKQQNNIQGGGGGTSSSSPPVFNKMPAREHLELLLQELSTKDQALQSAGRTIEEKNQLLQEYEGSLANALNLLQCMNVRCTDAKEETAKVLTEAEKIFGKLTDACNAVEFFDCSIPHCARGIHSLEEPSIAPVDDSHFFFGLENGLEKNQLEIDERRNLVEELLKELGNIELARKEAQQGIELQIQRDEQLIAELQELDVAPPVVEGATSDRDGNSIDQGKGNQSDHADKYLTNQGKGNLSDHSYKSPSDQPKGNVSHRTFDVSTVQAEGNICDHVYENSDDQANENLPSDQTHENASDHSYKDPFDKLREKPFDHVSENPNEQANETLCDHVFENPRTLADEISYDHAYEKPGDQSNENQCDHVYENLQDQSNENRCDLSYESPLHEANDTPYGHFHEQTNENPCDHEFESSSECFSEYRNEIPFENPHDYAYEDGKDCGRVFVLNDIRSMSSSSAESDKQLAESLNEVELKVFEEIEFTGRAYRRKRPNLVARASGPNALWEHLQHFVRNQPRASDVAKNRLTTQPIKVQGDLDFTITRLQSQLGHRTDEVSLLHKQLNEMRNALVLEQETTKLLKQKAIDIHPGPTKADLDHRDKVIHKMHIQMHQLAAALCQEREESREALAQKTNEFSRTQVTDDPALKISVQVDMDDLRRSLHLKDENIRELHESIAQKEVAWQAEKHEMMKCFDDMETKLLVKEEEAIKLAHELEISRSSVYSQRPDELRFKGDKDVHFFHNQGKEEVREILDLRCEVLSLQDCLGIKTQAIKTMEKELARSYSIVTELRSKLRGVQDHERNSQRKGQNTDLIERLRNLEEKLQRSQSEKAQMSRKIEDLAARCKYFEDFEHLHKEGSDDKKEQAIKELEKELERNVQIIKNLQSRCNEHDAYFKKREARNNSDPPGRSVESRTYDSWGQDHIKLVQLSEEKEALAAECDKLRSEMVHFQEQNERKGKLLFQLQNDMQNVKKKQIPVSQGTYRQNEAEPRSGGFSDDGGPKNAKTNTQSTNSVLDLGKVESADANTLRELLRGQWKVQKVMEDRLNSMMAYISDRVDEFERNTSDATSDSSFGPITELNHFHVEAKLMKLQLGQQLQVLRGTAFTSLPTSGVASPGQFTQNTLATQNLQLLVEKNALEDSAQTLQEKTSRLLNRLTFMRTEFNSQ